MKKIAVEIVHNSPWSFPVKPFGLPGWSTEFENLCDLTIY